MPPYQEKYAVGSKVRVAPKEVLENFYLTWKYHNPLKRDQFEFADKKTEIRAIGFYHGGDVLYELKDIPGTWHEICLDPA